MFYIILKFIYDFKWLLYDIYTSIHFTVDFIKPDRSLKSRVDLILLFSKTEWPNETIFKPCLLIIFILNNKLVSLSFSRYLFKFEKKIKEILVGHPDSKI